jgi:hypothetical protein
MVDHLMCQAMEDYVLGLWDEKKGVPQGVSRIKDIEWADFFTSMQVIRFHSVVIMTMYRKEGARRYFTSSVLQ